MRVDEPDWLERVGDALDKDGVCIVEDILDAEFVEETRRALYAAEDAIVADVGKETIASAKKQGDNALRLLLKYDPFFFKLLEIHELNQILDNYLSPFATLKYISGAIHRAGENGEHFQQREFHRNTRQLHPGCMTSMDLVFPLDDWDDEGFTLYVCPGSQRQGSISEAALEESKLPLSCKAGACVLLDSTVWHYEAQGTSVQDRLCVDLQFTMPYIKPHLDFVRALGDDVLLQLPERTRRYMGWDSRVPSNLKEFYVPAEERLYKGGQP